MFRGLFCRLLSFFLLVLMVSSLFVSFVYAFGRSERGGLEDTLEDLVFRGFSRSEIVSVLGRVRRFGDVYYNFSGLSIGRGGGVTVVVPRFRYSYVNVYDVFRLKGYVTVRVVSGYYLYYKRGERYYDLYRVDGRYFKYEGVFVKDYRCLSGHWSVVRVGEKYPSGKPLMIFVPYSGFDLGGLGYDVSFSGNVVTVKGSGGSIVVTLGNSSGGECPGKGTVLEVPGVNVNVSRIWVCDRLLNNSRIVWRLVGVVDSVPRSYDRSRYRFVPVNDRKVYVGTFSESYLRTNGYWSDPRYVKRYVYGGYRLVYKGRISVSQAKRYSGNRYYLRPIYRSFRKPIYEYVCTTTNPSRYRSGFRLFYKGRVRKVVPLMAKKYVFNPVRLDVGTGKIIVRNLGSRGAYFRIGEYGKRFFVGKRSYKSFSFRIVPLASGRMGTVNISLYVLKDDEWRLLTYIKRSFDVNVLSNGLDEVSDLLEANYSRFLNLSLGKEFWDVASLSFWRTLYYSLPGVLAVIAVNTVVGVPTGGLGVLALLVVDMQIYAGVTGLWVYLNTLDVEQAFSVALDLAAFGLPSAFRKGDVFLIFPLSIIDPLRRFFMANSLEERAEALGEGLAFLVLIASSHLVAKWSDIKDVSGRLSRLRFLSSELRGRIASIVGDIRGSGLKDTVLPAIESVGSVDSYYAKRFADVVVRGYEEGGGDLAVRLGEAVLEAKSVSIHVLREFIKVLEDRGPGSVNVAKKCMRLASRIGGEKYAEAVLSRIRVDPVDLWVSALEKDAFIARVVVGDRVRVFVPREVVEALGLRSGQSVILDVNGREFMVSLGVAPSGRLSVTFTDLATMFGEDFVRTGDYVYISTVLRNVGFWTRVAQPKLPPVYWSFVKRYVGYDTGVYKILLESGGKRSVVYRRLTDRGYRFNLPRGFAADGPVHVTVLEEVKPSVFRVLVGKYGIRDVVPVRLSGTGFLGLRIVTGSGEVIMPAYIDAHLKYNAPMAVLDMGGDKVFFILLDDGVKANFRYAKGTSIGLRMLKVASSNKDRYLAVTHDHGTTYYELINGKYVRLKYPTIELYATFYGIDVKGSTNIKEVLNTILKKEIVSGDRHKIGDAGKSVVKYNLETLFCIMFKVDRNTINIEIVDEEVQVISQDRWGRIDLLIKVSGRKKEINGYYIVEVKSTNDLGLLSQRNIEGKIQLDKYKKIMKMNGRIDLADVTLHYRDIKGSILCLVLFYIDDKVSYDVAITEFDVWNP